MHLTWERESDIPRSGSAAIGDIMSDGIINRKCDLIDKFALTNLISRPAVVLRALKREKERKFKIDGNGKSICGTKKHTRSLAVN
jgi:hypothetical protein